MTAVTKRHVRVRAKHFAAAYLFTGTSELRYYLQGVLVEPHPDGGVLLVATDGHRMVAIKDDEGETNGTWICSAPSEIVALCRKSVKRFDLAPGDVHFVDTIAYVTAVKFRPGPDKKQEWGDPSKIDKHHLGIAYAPAIDGTYPDWRQVYPKSEPTETSSFIDLNGEFLADFSRAAKILSGGMTSAINICPSGPTDPILINVETMEGNIAGLLMPMRGLGKRQSVPDWIGIKSEPTANAKAKGKGKGKETDKPSASASQARRKAA